MIRIVLAAWTTVLTLAALAGIVPNAAAQSYPSRPVTLVLPFVSGSVLENFVRLVTAEASKTFGQQVIIENRPGANQRFPIIGMKKAAPDGYYLALVNDALMTTHAIADPTFRMELGKDYEPVAYLASFPLVVAAHPSVPFRDIKGMIEYAKANPGKLNMVGGPGSITQTTAERIRQAGGFQWTFVPYKDAQQAMPDLLEGRVHLTITAAILKPGIDSGKLVGLATTGPARWSLFPSLPTLKESGLDISVTAWYGILAPVRTPQDVVRKVNDAYVAALKTPEVEKRLRDNSYTTGYMTPQQFGEFIRAEQAALAPIIKAAGIKIE